MYPRLKTPALAWLLLLGLGCSGLGGAGGCGCGSCAAIPGGFPDALRQNNAVTAKITKSGLDALKVQLGQFVSGNGSNSIGYPVPCTDASQKINIGNFGLSYTLTIFACDLDNDFACTPADDSPALRVDEPPHGVSCSAMAAVKNIDITPTQAADGTVDVAVVLQVRVNTGKIYINAKASGLCNHLRCAIEYDSDERAPTEIPVSVRLKLRVDPAWKDILALDVVGLDEISKSVDVSELHVTAEPGSSCSFGCNLINADTVKQLLFKSLQGTISRNINNQMDRLKCLKCEPVTGACPQGTTCEASQGVCYSLYQPSNNPAQDKRACPPAKLGVEGRADLGPKLAAFGGPESAPLDAYVVAGGRNPDGSSSTRVQTGGIVLGMMGGTDAPQPSACVPPTPWVARAPQTPVDFDVEAVLDPPIGPFALGLALSDSFLDKALYDVWNDGAVCLNVDQRTSKLLSSGLFGTFIRTLPGLVHGEDVPMLIALRPHRAPNVVIGRGTTKPGPNGTQVPDDPLLTLQMDELSIDFYALVEERYSRLFSLVADVKLPLSLEFDPVAGTLQPVLGGLDALLTNVHAKNVELLGDDPAELEAVIPQIIGLVQPQLAGVIQPIALPALQGFKLDVVGARGAVKFATAPGYEHLALFTQLSLAPPPLVARTDTEARLVESRLPTGAEAFAGAQPVAVIQAHALGVHPRGAVWEYSYRVDGGLWSLWQTNDRLEVARPVLRLQGHHDIDVRARFSGSAASVDGSPARVPFAVDYDPPAVKLTFDPEAREVRTSAHDTVSADETLGFRYRVAGGAFGELGPAQLFALGDLGRQPSLEVEAVDEAGHVGRATFGEPGDQASQVPGRGAGEAGGGCSAVPASALAFLGLALRRRRGAR